MNVQYAKKSTLIPEFYGVVIHFVVSVSKNMSAESVEARRLNAHFVEKNTNYHLAGLLGFRKTFIYSTRSLLKELVVVFVKFTPRKICGSTVVIVQLQFVGIAKLFHTMVTGQNWCLMLPQI